MRKIFSSIYRFFSDSFHLFRSSEGAEIRHHAVIGGAITFTLIVFELHQKQSWYDLLTGWRLWLVPLSVGIVAFCLAFFAIAVLEVFLNRPVRLKDVGYVDGYWVCALRNVNSGHYDYGAIIRVQSSGLGFRIKGWSYSRERLEKLRDDSDASISEGQFVGVGWERSSDSIHFHYRGQEDSHNDDGVGYYKFVEQKDASLRLEGGFTGFTLGPEGSTTTRELHGKKATGDEEIEFKNGDKLDFVLTYLEGQKAEPFHLPDVGAIDGTWLEAIYEKDFGPWKLIEGSIVTIDSLSTSGLFQLEGRAFTWSPNTRRTTWKGMFRGTGHIYTKGLRSMYFGFFGYEDKNELGAGYYSFVEADNTLRFDGTFLRGIGDPLRLVFGKRLKSATEDQSRLESELIQYLQECGGTPPSGLPK
jgi:hypothetical protein